MIQILMILGTALLGGIIARKIKLPIVLGQMAGSLVLGPAFLNITQMSASFHIIANLGVWLLMYEAGMSVDLPRLRSNIKIANRVAWFGALLPFVTFFLIELLLDQSSIVGLFSGLVFSATSISITLAILSEQQKMGSLAGSVILGAAIIDDLIAIIGLTIITIFSSNSGNVTSNLINLIPLASFVLGVFSQRASGMLTFNHHLIKIAQWSVMPFFFATVGLQINFNSIQNVWLQLISFTIIAILTKLVGAYIASRTSKLDWLTSLAIGSGMVARGEMAFVILAAGLSTHIIHTQQFSFYTAIVTLTTVLAPFIIQPLFKRLPKK